MTAYDLEISGRICNDMLMARYLYTLVLLRVITGGTLLSVALRMVADLHSIFGKNYRHSDGENL
jgi:hypothetical protein